MRRPWLIPLLFLAGCWKSGPTPEQLHARVLSAIRHGDLPSAHRLLLSKARYAWHSDDKSEWFWRFRLLEGELAFTEGNSTQARQLLSRLIPPVADQARLEGKRLVELASIETRATRYQDAEKLLNQAASACVSDAQLQLEIEVARSVLAMRSRRGDLADSLLQTAYKHALALNDLYYQAALLVNFGSIRFNRFHYDEAVPYFEEAAETAQRCGADLIASSALGNLAICSYRLGDFKRALTLRLKAADIQRKMGARTKLQVSLGEFGNIELLQGNPGKAIPYYSQAMAIAREVEDREYAAQWASNLASAYAEVGDWTGVERTIKEIGRSELVRDNPRLSAELTFNQAAIAAARGNTDQAFQRYDLLLRSRTGDPAVLWQAHAQLADLYRRTGNRLLAAQHFQEALDLINKTRSDLLRNEYKITFLNGLIRFYQRYVDALVEDGEYAKALDVADSSRARVLSEKLGIDRSRLTIGKVTPSLLAKQSDATILFYWLAPARSYLWIITPGRTTLVRLPGQDALAELVDKHARAILNLRDPLALSLPASRQLSDLVVGQAKQYFGRSNKFIIVPDGALYGLSFDSLLQGDHYWIENATLAIAPSLGILERAQGRIRERGPLLLIGAPDYRRSEYPPLPHAGEELAAIRQIVRDRSGIVYAGAEALPAAYKNSSPNQFALIHFAAHAEANPDSPLDSAIILSRDKTNSYKLYARDVLDFPLRAELVTVSACRSAGARSYAGEGLVGFAWAFLRAGAGNVVGGLWNVDDDSTASMMKSLYSNFESGKTPPEALRDAKLALIRSSGRYKKPYYWAPFQVYIRSYH
jgi:CHAT domain-containing protein/Tfp pilus assembly protein PilF